MWMPLIGEQKNTTHTKDVVLGFPVSHPSLLVDSVFYQNYNDNRSYLQKEGNCMKLWITSKMTKIYRIELGGCNCYLLERNGRYILVDTGFVTQRNKIVHALEANRIHKLEAIFLTHVHTDNAGNAAYLSRMFHCRVYGPKKELESLMTGHCQVAVGMGRCSRVLNYIMYRMDICTKFDGVNNAAAYLDEEAAVMKSGGSAGWGITILKTPGHTEGSVSILVDGEVALVGDVMSHSFVGNIYPTFAEEEDEILPSWKKLLQQNCKLFMPAHGRIIRRRLLQESYSVHLQNKNHKDRHRN